MGHGRDMAPKPYGIVAEFDSPQGLLDAAKAAKAAGYRDIDGYSPIPVHGLTDVIEFKDDRLSFLVFGGGVSGAVVGLALQSWTSMIAYPHNVGGKPTFSLPMFFPVLYECTILFAAGAATVFLFALNGLPKPHQPIFNASCMSRASSDRYILCIEAGDPNFNVDETTKFLEGLNPLSVEYVLTSEGY